jgi:DNA-directed RNA polymerase specialized sigma24 family protein
LFERRVGVPVVRFLRPRLYLYVVTKKRHTVRDSSGTDGFESFVREVEPRLKRALIAALGVERGLEAAAEAVSYGWQHWDRVHQMENPAGYLYRVGRSQGKPDPRPMVLPMVDPHTPAWVEPGLPAALAKLSEGQRTSVMLVHTFEYTFAEAAELLGVSKSTVQTQVERGLDRLRIELGVTL